MPRSRINPRSVKINFSYSVEEAARVLGVHKNTIRGWIKQGLPVVDCKRPVLILGRCLRKFLEGRRKAAKCQCPPGTIYCFKCRCARRPALGMVDFIPLTAATGNLRALCEACETPLYRRARTDAIGSVMPNLAVQCTGGEQTIRDRADPSVICDLQQEGDPYGQTQRR